MCWCCHQCPMPILSWPQHAQLATGGTYQQQAYAFSFSFLWFNSEIIFTNVPIASLKSNSSPLLLLCCGWGFAVWRSDAGFLRFESREHKLGQLKWQYYVYSFIIKVNIAPLRHSWKLSQLRVLPVNTLHAGCITVVSSSGHEEETWKKPWHFEERGH